MHKLNLGCGRDYRQGWLNADANRAIRADVYLNMNAGLPFRENSVECVLLDNVLEHVHRDRYFHFLDELHRVCENGARIEIYVPHFTSMFAVKHPAHYTCFGIGSFDLFGPDDFFNGERYAQARFNVLEQRLLFFHHNLVTVPMLSRLPINCLFNFGILWQLVMERFQFFGFDEIHYVVEVEK